MNTFQYVKEKIQTTITPKHIAIASTVTTVIVFAFFHHRYGRSTMLELTKESIDKLQTGGAMIYIVDNTEYALTKLNR